MMAWITRLGILTGVMTDGASDFSGEVFNEYVRMLASVHHITLAGIVLCNQHCHVEDYGDHSVEC